MRSVRKCKIHYVNIYRQSYSFCAENLNESRESFKSVKVLILKLIIETQGNSFFVIAYNIISICCYYQLCLFETYMSASYIL